MNLQITDIIPVVDSLDEAPQKGFCFVVDGEAWRLHKDKLPEWRVFGGHIAEGLDITVEPVLRDPATLTTQETLLGHLRSAPLTANLVFADGIEAAISEFCIGLPFGRILISRYALNKYWVSVSTTGQRDLFYFNRSRIAIPEASCEWGQVQLANLLPILAAISEYQQHGDDTPLGRYLELLEGGRD